MDILTTLHKMADHADEIALSFFQKTTLKVTDKSDHSPVSEADLAIEMRIRDIAAVQLPNHAVWGEEFGLKDPNARQKLLIDPIDATRNFIRGIPFFATLLAIEEDGQIIAGLISAPATQDRWCAVLGEGAYHNNQRIHVSTLSEISHSQAFHGSLYGPEADTVPVKSVLALLSQTQRQRGIGDYYGHMLTAMGCGEFTLDFGLKPWDMAPLKIIVEEAGGKVTNLNSEFSLKNGDVVTSNGALHSMLLFELEKNN